MFAPRAARPRPGRRGSLPLRIVVAVLVVLSAGCGGPTKFPDEAGGADTGVRTDGSTTTRPAPSAASGSSTTQPVVTAAPAPTTTARATGAPARTPTTRAPAPTVNAGEQAIVRAAQGPPGGAAGVILQPTPAAALVVEVMEQPGAAANRVALNRVLADLRRYSGKSVTEVRTALPAGSSSKRWTEGELETLADRSAKVPQGGGKFVLRLLFVRGQNARSGSILAVTFRGDTFAAFPDRYASSGQNIITAVTVHEVGHLLGLVDLYLERGRADTQNDPAGQGHSPNQGSVMYFGVDPSLLGSIFGSASDRFDAQDERDLAAIRAGATRGSNPR